MCNGEGTVCNGEGTVYNGCKERVHTNTRDLLDQNTVYHRWAWSKCGWVWLTSAPDPGVLGVVAVVHIGRVALAVGQVEFRSIALHVVQYDWSRSPSEQRGPHRHSPLPQEPQLPAHHLGVGCPPEVVAHGTPLPLHVHLHATLVGGVSADQSDWRSTLLECYVVGGNIITQTYTVYVPHCEEQQKESYMHVC